MHCVGEIFALNLSMKTKPAGRINNDISRIVRIPYPLRSARSLPTALHPFSRRYYTAEMLDGPFFGG